MMFVYRNLYGQKPSHFLRHQTTIYEIVNVKDEKMFFYNSKSEVKGSLNVR